jgi:hypothetical protein
MKFLRFSYLIDFMAMHSLRNVYNASVDEFKRFIKSKVEEPEVFLLKENAKDFRSNIEPLFAVNLSFDITAIRPAYKESI